MINEKIVYVDSELFSSCFNCNFTDFDIIGICHNGLYLNVNLYDTKHKKTMAFTYILPNTAFDKYNLEITKKLRLEKLKRILC